MMDAKRAPQEGQFGKKAEQKYHWANPPKERDAKGEERKRKDTW